MGSSKQKGTVRYGIRVGQNDRLGNQDLSPNKKKGVYRVNQNALRQEYTTLGKCFETPDRRGSILNRICQILWAVP